MGLTRKTVFVITLGIGSVCAWLAWQHLPVPLPQQWSEQELVTIRALSLDSLPTMPPDPGNPVADDPLAAELGHQLFFDTRLSADGNISCASCHQPEHHFTDQLPLGVGLATGDRNTMGLVGAAYSPWLFWDGRKDSLWAQALEPLENPLEHGISREQAVELIISNSDYREHYQQIFGPLPGLMADKENINHIFANIGRALAAYQRLLLPGPARFDQYADALSSSTSVKQASLESNEEIMTKEEIAGLRLFISKAQCVDCHNGPLFTNNSFHNTAVLPAAGMIPAMGRASGLRLAQEDPFNCLGAFSAAPLAACQELRFARGGDEMIGAQRTPSLRNLDKTPPYMHAGQIADLSAVIEHYNNAGVALVGHNEAKPLRLRAIEKKQLEAFLQTLNGPLATDPRWLQPPDQTGSATVSK